MAGRKSIRRRAARTTAAEGGAAAAPGAGEPADLPLTFAPATAERWPDVEALFGANGACGGCWCRFWHQTQAEYRAGKGEPNRRALRAQVRAGAEPGLLAYRGSEPVGWAAVAPRSAYERLATSRNLQPPGGPGPAEGVWSVPCFFVRRGHRRQGVAGALIAAAAAHARARGAEVLEAYPVDSSAALGAAFLYTGAFSTFVRLGFVEVARRARTRPVVRLPLAPAGPGAREGIAAPGLRAREGIPSRALRAGGGASRSSVAPRAPGGRAPPRGAGRSRRARPSPSR